MHLRTTKYQPQSIADIQSNLTYSYQNNYRGGANVNKPYQQLQIFSARDKVKTDMRLDSNIID